VLSVRSGEVEVLAAGLREPLGVAVSSDDTCLISESGAGRVVKLARGGVETVLDGLQKPQGILVRGDLLYVVDTGAKELVEYHLASGSRRTIAADLPIGAPAGIVPKFLRGIGDMSGPMGPFAGITDGADGTLYISADAVGSVLALRPVSDLS
jgi:sugar lactone lactonase YvrE